MALRDKYDTRKTGERAQKPDAVSAEGLTYDVQRTPPPAVQEKIRDECAVDLISGAFRRALFDITVAEPTKQAGALDHDIIFTFLGALIDGSLVDMLVHVSDHRAAQLVALVKRYDELTQPPKQRIDISHRRERKRKVNALTETIVVVNPTAPGRNEPKPQPR